MGERKIFSPLLGCIQGNIYCTFLVFSIDLFSILSRAPSDLATTICQRFHYAPITHDNCIGGCNTHACVQVSQENCSEGGGEKTP